MDAADKDKLAKNLVNVRERIAAACARAKRDPREVTLIAVTKNVVPEVMQALIELGVIDIGENKLQAAQEKFPLVPGLRDRTQVRRHFIGHLQTNKVKGVLELFDVIHSVDSVKLAQEIDKRATQLGVASVSCFIELNCGEEDKSGVELSDLPNLYGVVVNECNHLHLLGLMSMAPANQSAEWYHMHFNQVAKTAFLETEAWAPSDGSSLSMGMSNDFEVAIEEGATHVRIGTALFEGLQ